jgi:NitT/TauT family transport system substrate-binding protein
MRTVHVAPWARRTFLRGLALAGTARLLGLPPRLVAAEPPPETTRLRVHHSLSLCLAPQYVAEELLRGEGFTEVHYVTHEESGGFYPALASSGAVDIGNDFAPVLIRHLDAGEPITILLTNPVSAQL